MFCKKRTQVCPVCYTHIILETEELRYAASQAGLLTQLQRRKHLPGFHQWHLFAAPLHSSGPVGDSHSIPFSPAHTAQAPVSF